MQDAIGSYTYLFYTSCLLILTIFLFIYLPETKQRTFDEIVQSLLRHKKTTLTLESGRERAPTEVEVYEMEVADEITDEGSKKAVDLSHDLDVLTSTPNII